MSRLLRGIARTAVISGTATAVSGRVQRNQAARFAQSDAQTAVLRRQAYDDVAAPPATTPPPAAPAPAPADVLEQLTTLAALKAQGILTDEELAIQKARILGG
ncbi:SHOCT domain-containing protein [Sanguibacter sp. 25GB23B1]|uniref:SHOCT domain-containing protein n=1 Tax=unclassified Sanguibacter TaxID=2645534 RepID=UPI0032AFD558